MDPLLSCIRGWERTNTTFLFSPDSLLALEGLHWLQRGEKFFLAVRGPVYTTGQPLNPKLVTHQPSPIQDWDLSQELSFLITTPVISGGSETPLLPVLLLLLCPAPPPCTCIPPLDSERDLPACLGRDVKEKDHTVLLSNLWLESQPLETSWLL